MDVLASVRQPSTFRMLIWPEASNAQNSIAAVSADGSTVCVLIRRLNSSCRRSIALVVRALRHWLGGSRVKVKRQSPASSRLSATARHLSRHLRMKALRRGKDSTSVSFPLQPLKPHNARTRARAHARPRPQVAAALPTVSRFACAQTYPSRPVRIIVKFPAGQATDTIARLMGQSLSERLGQPFVVENRTGAGGNIGTESVVRATPDGYTLLLVGLSNAMNATLYKKLNFNFIREIAPVASIGGTPYVMMINPSVPAKTVPECIAYAKVKPGKINMGSSGNGAVSHVFGERFKVMTGINLVHVPYRGGYYPDLLSGQVQVAFGTISTCIQYIRGGMLRALAVTTATRSGVLPDIPTLAEL